MGEVRTKVWGDDEPSLVDVIEEFTIDSVFHYNDDVGPPLNNWEREFVITVMERI